MNTMNTGVYAIKNLVNSKMYIGSSYDFKRRFRSHKAEFRSNDHHNIKLQRAWNKHGSENFAFEKLIVCSKEDLIMYEQRAIDIFDVINNGYNIAPNAGNPGGYAPSEETREKLRKSSTGKKHTDETKLRLSELAKGRVIAKETRAKLSAVHKGRIVTTETRAKISAAHKGMKFPDSARKKLSEANTGRKASEETKAKMSESHKKRWENMPKNERNEIALAISGRKRTEESRAKMSASQKGRKQSPEHVAKRKATIAAKLAAKSAPQQESAQ